MARRRGAGDSVLAGSLAGIREWGAARLLEPLYLFVQDYTVTVIAFVVQGAFLGAIYGQNPSYLSERFPTEDRATASGSLLSSGAIWAVLAAPVLAIFAAGQPLGFAVPMLISTVGAAIIFVVVLLFGPETKGKVLVADLRLAEI